MKRIPRTPRRGFTLIEMVCVMATLGLLLAFSTGLIITLVKSGTVAEKLGDRVHQRTQLARQFRADVAAAKVAPVKVGDRDAGPTLLGLLLPDGSTITYRWDEEVLTRTENQGGREVVHRIPIDLRNATVEFTRPASGSRLIALRITETPAKGPVVVSEFSATIGGNLR